MAKFDVLKIATDSFGEVIKFFDTAYKENWLIYLIIGLIALVVVVIIYN